VARLCLCVAGTREATAAHRILDAIKRKEGEGALLGILSQVCAC
jgi:hypothetical protein